MVKEELIERSPVRFFENETKGGLKAGEIGLLTSKKGLGKTSVLVQIGLDMLLQDKQVVHVSFDQHSDYVIRWYNDILAEMAKKKNVGNISDIADEIIRKRVILNFNQDSVSMLQIVKSIKALGEAGIKPACVVVDDINLSKITVDDIKIVKDFAKEANLIVWFCSNNEATDLASSIKAELLPFVDSVIHLLQKTDMIEMSILKMRDEKITTSNLKLDSKTLLIAEK